MTNLKSLAIVASFASMLFAAPISSTARPSNELLTGINVSGLANDINSGASSAFTGTASITGFAFDAVNRVLLVEGVLNGIISADGVSTQVLGQAFTTSGTLSGNGGRRCEILNLDLGPLFLDLLGLQIDLSDIQLDITAVQGPGRLLGNLLCALVRLLDGNATATQIDRQLNRINNILGTLLTNLGVSGIANNGTFSGLLTITGFAIDNAGNLVISGILNGLATADGLTTKVIALPINVLGILDGTGSGGRCQILTLDLGPLNLDLLGLQIDLSEVNLDLTATQGSGNLLGNLLCSLSRALDGGGNNQLRRLGKLVQRINGLLPIF